MTTYVFPSIVPSASTWELLSNTATYVSPITGSVQSLDRGGERWKVTMAFQYLHADDKAEMKAFLTKLNGQQHRFTLYDHSQVQRGNFGGTPLVFGGSQTGTSLNIDGVSNTTDWIRAGDYFAVNGELKMAIADTDTAAAAGTLTFRPRLRSAPADNDPITTTNPTGTFLLADNSVGWANLPGDFGNFTIVCIEDIAA